jgi:hypothetical protein
LAVNIARVSCFVAFLVLGLAHSIQAAPHTFVWDYNPNAGVAGYSTSASVTGLTYGPSYYFVQAHSSDGAVGAPSSAVSGQLSTVAPLAIWCPSPLLTSFDGKAVSVTLTPKVTGEGTPITTTCSPASGSLFPVGKASFICNAVDALQQKASCRSTVIVMSATARPPASLTLKCPAITPVVDTGHSGRMTVKFADPTFSGGLAVQRRHHNRIMSGHR